MPAYFFFTELLLYKIGVIIKNTKNSDITIHRHQYSHIEDGRAKLKIDDLIKLFRYYKVSADYFIGISDQK